MVFETLYRFPADMSVLQAIQGLVDRLAVNFEAATVARAQTAIEELFANIVHHGVRACAGPVEVGVAVQVVGDTLHIHIEDECLAFDPFAGLDVALAQTTLPVEQRQIGGLGRLMVQGLADKARYVREGKRNCIELHFRVRPGPSATGAPAMK